MTNPNINSLLNAIVLGVSNEEREEVKSRIVSLFSIILLLSTIKNLIVTKKNVKSFLSRSINEKDLLAYLTTS
jgi:hypothetical protein